MSVRAELLRLALRLLKKWHSRRYVPIGTARRRLKRIEAFVPRPPAGTQTTAVDAGGVNAVRVAVRQARSDRCVLYFHGGAYAIGTAKLLRDFTWRIGAAARAHVLYFDYRPIAGWPAGSIPGGSPSWAIRRAAGSRWRRSTSCAM